VLVTRTTFGTVHRGDNRTVVSADGETLYDWAHRGDCRWPCSTLARLDRITVGFDSSGDLVDIEHPGAADIPADELNAWTSEVLVRAGYPNRRVWLCPQYGQPAFFYVYA